MRGLSPILVLKRIRVGFCGCAMTTGTILNISNLTIDSRPMWTKFKSPSNNRLYEVFYGIDYLFL